MALTCWLPLLGATENLGCGNITAINNGAVIDNNGKIGKCYSFNGNNYYIALTGQELFDCFKGGTTAFSICMWVYHADTRRAILFGDYGLSNSIGFNIELNTGHSLRFYWNGSPDYSPGINVGLNTWSHITLTYDGASLKSYLNGNLIATRDGTLAARSKTAGEFRLGRDTRTTDTALNGKLNDIRVYGDHALSAAEVKEISQGLVLHYKLDSGYNESTTNLCGTSAGGWNNSGTCTRTVNDTAILGKPTTSNTYSVRATSDGSMALTCGTTTANHPSKTIIASVYVWLDGTQDSSSFYLRSTKTDGSVGNLMYNGNANPSTWPRQQWIRINTNAINTASDATTFYICTYVNKNTEVRAVNGWQIEEKDHVTPYTASGTTRTDIVIQDDSGYNYNGTIIGDPYIVTNSARYENAMYFTGRPCAINSVSVFSHLNTFTYSCWFKRNTNEGAVLIMGYQYGNNSSGSLSIVNDKPGFHYYAHANGNGDTQVGITQTCNDNQWHHLAATYDGTKVISYFDGVKTTEQNVTLLTTTRTFSINYTNTGSSNRDYQGALSDVRVYCTTLDADAILQLYHTGAKIDNKANFHTYEINENGTNKLTKTGIMYDNMEESIMTLPDGSHWQLLMFHYVDNGHNLFTRDNAAYCNDFGLYSRLRDIDGFKLNNQYEFYVIQDDIEYRWTQTNAPATSTSPGTVTTVSGYNNPSVGLAKNCSNTYLGYNSWWGACGCWTLWNGNAIPGFGGRNCTKYLALYARIEKADVKLSNQTANTSEFIEL